MSQKLSSILCLGLILSGAGVATAARKASNLQCDPTAISLSPFTGQVGTTFLASVRGTNLANATNVFVESAPFTAAVVPAQPAASSTALPAPGASQATEESVQLRIQIASGATPGKYSIRLMTPRGISNSLALYIVDQPVVREPDGPHDTPATAVIVDKIPVVLSGLIGRRGETDYYAFDAEAGQKLTFEAISGLPTNGAPGGSTAGFDPSLSLYEPSGSWFDAKRLNRIAFNDESLWVVGKPTGAI